MVGMRAELVGLAEAIEDGLRIMDLAELDGVTEAAQGLKEELRTQVEAAGLGRRLATTWQAKVYPNKDSGSGPAALVFSKAPKIISLFARGGVVRPHDGRNYLWIPQPAVPVSFQHAGGGSRRGGKPRMTPEEVERHFNQDLYIRRLKRGGFGAFLNLVKAKSTRRPGYRQATKGRVKQGRAVEPILMFVLKRSLVFQKKLDVEGAGNRWGARLPELIDKHWRE